uniref:Uncharacterized protein n=1 Tax=Arundo donax TaxID=35708 RepID=A0A0A8YW56_ARUDO
MEVSVQLSTCFWFVYYRKHHKGNRIHQALQEPSSSSQRHAPRPSLVQSTSTFPSPVRVC